MHKMVAFRTGKTSRMRKTKMRTRTKMILCSYNVGEKDFYRIDSTAGEIPVDFNKFTVQILLKKFTPF